MDLVALVLNEVDEGLKGGNDPKLYNPDDLGVFIEAVTDGFNTNRRVLLLSDHGHTWHLNKDRRQGDQVGADVSIADCPVVGAPVVHDRIYVCERAPPGDPGHEPGRGPGGIGARVQGLVYSLGQLDRVSLGDLQGRPEALDQIDARHGHGHAAAGAEVRRPAAAPEILDRAGVPGGGFETAGRILWRDLPEWLDRGVAVDQLLNNRRLRAAELGIAKCCF